MKVIVPKPITLISSNVAEDTTPEWDESTTYSSGDEVLVTGLGENGITKKYKSLQDNNTGHYPPDNPDWWEDEGATNKWKMFDNYVTTQTENSSSIDVTFTSNKISHVALFNVEAEDGTIEVRDSNDTLLATYNFSLRLDQSTSWSDYFFGDFYYRTAYIQQIPYILGEAKIRVVLTKTGTVKCGMLIVGYAHYLGCTLFGLRAGILDYSRKETDSYGRTYLAQGAWAKKTEFDVEIPNGSIDKIQRLLADLRATPCVWDANNDDTDYDSLIIYGFYKDFDIILTQPLFSKCEITIEGLI